MNNQKHILVVEDDVYMNETLCDILTDSGYLVQNSEKATEAINMLSLNDSKYNLLILDYNLNGYNSLSGIDVFKAAKKINPEIKAIMISAYGNRLIKEQALTNGINLYLDKPFLISELTDAVNILI